MGCHLRQRCPNLQPGKATLTERASGGYRAPAPARREVPPRSSAVRAWGFQGPDGASAWGNPLAQVPARCGACRVGLPAGKAEVGRERAGEGSRAAAPVRNGQREGRFQKAYVPPERRGRTAPL
ncbi:hypothetical protein GCM10010286_54720 [Streptomyces toxytricini]|nr:hypothetical protein GCM10010286_54720 [Streptomyces toxytricini]